MRPREHFGRQSLGRRVALRALAAFVVTFAILRVITGIIHALWLRLADVYWSREGLESVKAGAVAAAALAGYGFGQPALHGIARDLARATRRRR